MTLEEGKENPFMAETSSGAVSSENPTPKSLKAKPKIAKKAVVNSATNTSEMKDPPVQGRKKVLKKKIVAVKKGRNNVKEDVQNANSGDMENKNVLNGEQGVNNHENLKNNKSVPGNEKSIPGDMEIKNVLSGEEGKNNPENLNNMNVPGSEKSVPGDMENKNVLSGEQGKNNHENLKNECVAGSEKIHDMINTAGAQNLNGEKLKEEIITGEHIESNPGNLKRKKKVIVVRKKIKRSNEDGFKAQTEEEPESVISAERSKKRPEIGKDKVQSHEKNTEKFESKALNKEESESVISAEKSKKRPEIGKDKVQGHEKNTKKFESKALNKEESESVISAEKSKKRPEIGKDKVQGHEKSTKNSDGSSDKWLKQIIENIDGLSRKKNNQKNKEKLSGSVENEQKIEKEGKKDQLEGEWKEEINKKVGGLILFCNAKTKSDCFHYHIMGVSSSGKDLVLDIKPGLKLFLYDFDIKLLYGIYSASSPGGTKLEPAAFNGAFPFQVRFEIYKDCYPLPESVFKRAIKENYDRNNKFNQELTSQQVNKLMELFKPSEVKQHALPLYLPRSTSVDKGEAKESKAEYLTHHRREPLAREPYTYDEGRRYDSHLNKNDEQLAYRPAPSAQREPSPEQLFISEKDYRTYGLRRERRNVSPPRSQVAPNLGPDSRAQEYHTPYSHFPKQELHSSAAHIIDSTASIVDSYLKVPYYGSSKDPYQLPIRAEREEVALGSYSLGRRETTYQPESSYISRRENHPSQRDYIMEASEVRRREKDEAGAFYSEHNQRRMVERAKPESSSHAPVSARYSFAGPSGRYL